MNLENWTVQQKLEAERIDLDLLETLDNGSGYWENLMNFVIEHWTRPVASLTPPQMTWLEKIVEDVTEKRIESRH